VLLEFDIVTKTRGAFNIAYVRASLDIGTETPHLNLEFLILSSSMHYSSLFSAFKSMLIKHVKDCTIADLLKNKR
jgi:hypothetical protein